MNVRIIHKESFPDSGNETFKSCLIADIDQNFNLFLFNKKK